MLTLAPVVCQLERLLRDEFLVEAEVEDQDQFLVGAEVEDQDQFLVGAEGNPDQLLVEAEVEYQDHEPAETHHPT